MTLQRRRTLFACTIAALSLFSSAPADVGHGTYSPDPKTHIPWSINSGHSLFWNGAPYMPVGVRVDADPTDIASAAKAGAKDVIVDVSSGRNSWDEALVALDASKLRFLLRINSLAPMAAGYEISPQTYRMPGIVSPQLVSMPMPGAKSALAVVVLKRDGSVLKVERVPVVDGKFNYFVRPGNDLEHVLYAYPETSSLQQLDWWEGLDQHRDELMGMLRRAHLGTGIRGIVNPLGNLLSLPGNEVTLIPSSPYFQSEFRGALLGKYHNVDVLQRSWGMSANGLLTFEAFCKLVPLWSGSSGPALLWNPENNRTYPVETRRSSYWRDVVESISTSANRRFSRLVRAIRKVVDLPVVQEWNGWSSLYEGDQPTVDGIGSHILGKTPGQIADAGSRPASTVLRQSRPVWQLATDVDPEAPLEDVASIGNRAVFYSALTNAARKTVVGQQFDEGLSTQALTPLYFPENATNPAFAQRLPNGSWWLPGPFEGNRIDLGVGFSAYRLRGPQGVQIVMWAQRSGRYRLRAKKPKLLGFRALDNSNPMPKLLPNGVELMVTTCPMIVTGTEECPVPEATYQATAAEFTELLKTSAEIHHDILEDRMFYGDYMKGYDTDPFSSITLMRQVNNRVAHKLGVVLWYEAENSRDTNFSGTSANTGCSGGSVLELRNPVVVPVSGFVASYPVPSMPGKYDVWLAAKIPIDKRGDVFVIAGNQSFGLLTPPTGAYGTGYGWYKIGSIRTGGSSQTVKIIVNGLIPGDIAIDCIVLTQVPFEPDGLNHPVIGNK